MGGADGLPHRPKGVLRPDILRCRQRQGRVAISLLTRPSRCLTITVALAYWEVYMSLQDRLESLKAKHAALEAAIEEETRRPLPDTHAIADLKRKKLKIKDELEHMAPH
jgi:hypothetical protein